MSNQLEKHSPSTFLENSLENPHQLAFPFQDLYEIPNISQELSIFSFVLLLEQLVHVHGAIELVVEEIYKNLDYLQVIGVVTSLLASINNYDKETYEENAVNLTSFVMALQISKKDFAIDLKNVKEAVRKQYDIALRTKVSVYQENIKHFVKALFVI